SHREIPRPRDPGLLSGKEENHRPQELLTRKPPVESGSRYASGQTCRDGRPRSMMTLDRKLSTKWRDTLPHPKQPQRLGVRDRGLGNPQTVIGHHQLQEVTSRF